MSKKSGIVALSRRSLLRGAAAAGAAAIAGQAVAQDAINDLINAPRRGNWDDQFDAQASRTAAAVVSNTPILSASNLMYMQQAISQHQTIVSNGGWPTINAPTALRIGAMDPAVQSLRQRLMISGDLRAFQILTIPTSTLPSSASRRDMACRKTACSANSPSRRLMSAPMFA